MNILVTGATGFVGRALIEHLLQSEHEVTAGVREFSSILPGEVNQVVLGDLVALADIQHHVVGDRKGQQLKSRLCGNDGVEHGQASKDSSTESVLSGAEGPGMTGERLEVMGGGPGVTGGDSDERETIIASEAKQSAFKSEQEVSELSATEPSHEFHVSDVNKLKYALQHVDTVVHTAARVHVMQDKASDPLTEFRKINTDATLSLARQAARAGVRRFIFLSTIKVNGELTSSEAPPSRPSPVKGGRGESTGAGKTPSPLAGEGWGEGAPTNKPFDETAPPDPQDPYAISKWEAEQGLMQIAKETGIEVVIIRPPLIYGPGVKGNFASMMKWVKRGIPLPLGAVQNQRSLLALDNLVTFISHCLTHPKAANEVFLLSDGEDVSTTALIQKLATVQGKKARLLPVPVSWMRFAACLLGKQDVADRLFGSLQIDSSKAKELLGWQPAVAMDEQLEKMVEQETP